MTLPPSAEQHILRGLAILAEQCGEKVSPERAAFMAKRLVPFGAKQVCDALATLMESARRFPTVAEIKSAMGVTEATDEDKAREVAERIWAAISKFGSQVGLAGQARVDEYLGPIGVEVAKLQGGWNHICETATNENATTLKAQLRELAAVIVRKERRGDLETPPDFTALPEATRDAVKQLEAKWTLPPAKGGN